MAANFDPNSFMNSLGQTVRAARKAAGLTQLELAELAEIGKSAVFDVEKGKVNVQLSTLLKVLRVLHIELNVQSPIDVPDREQKKTEAKISARKIR